MFVPMTYGVLDQEARTIDFVRGGHVLPVLVDGQGGWFEVSYAEGQVFGILKEPILPEQQITYGPTGLLLHTLS